MTRILVVDDENVTRHLVTHALKKIDIDTVGAVDGPQALDLAAQERFSLVIVDINLPEMDGFDVIRHLKQLPTMQDVPIILFTARSDEDDSMRALTVGAVELLYKPFSMQQLRDLVTKHLPPE
ncbi:MAG TPA: response regulator [Aggregatilinea sp.]|jgi:DNA-binding response OmpR family regulator|uniref:response regulator n=1 Tax=Aggregatilinea sp. TaxID=2806333 RepID=UPI002B75CAC8|nr:response regulator [Aggregatilinea sp.]HML20347.1 response regulator [Aggregatilinea sp.]